MRLEMEIKNLENVGSVTAEDRKKFEEIFTALISSGSLTGVKNGQVIIHFDHNADFAGVQLNYWPWKRRKA